MATIPLLPKRQMSEEELQAAAVKYISEKLKEESNYKLYLAKMEQARIAAELGKDRKSIDGLGRPRMEINAHTYHFYGQKYGYQIWKDKAFLRELERDNPEVRIKAQGTRGSGYVGSPGGAPEVPRAGKKFVKTYA